jgi:hypothetical protein
MDTDGVVVGLGGNIKVPPDFLRSEGTCGSDLFD